MLTDVDRDPYEAEVVLVTPEPYKLCPNCHEKGYDQRPGGTNPPPNTASVMPREYKDLPRQIGQSIVPAGTSIKPGASRIPSSTYNPSASRIPESVVTSIQASFRPSTRPSEVPVYSTHAPYPSQRSSSSQYPSSSRAPKGSHTPSTYPNTPFYPSKASTARPTVQAPGNTFGPSATEIANTAKPPMTAEDYLKRGAPKNAAASAFYDSVDGAEARARLDSESISPPVSSRPRALEVPRSVAPSFRPRGSEVPRSVAPTASKSPFESRTQAPPPGVASVDLEEMMAGATLAPRRESVRPGTSRQIPTVRPTERPSNSTSRLSEHPATSVARQASRTAAGHSVYPGHGSALSNYPSAAPSFVPRSEAPRSEVPRSSGLPRASHAPSHVSSRVPASSQAPARSHAPAQTALPKYKTMASQGSAYPSQPPPSFKTKAPKANGNGNRRVSTISEEH